MTSIGDVIGWIVGVLGGLVLFMWRYDKKQGDDAIRAIRDKQSDGLSRLAVAEEQLKGMQVHHMKTLDKIEAQQSIMAANVVEIKIALASMPTQDDKE